MGGPRDNEGTGGLSEEARSWSVPQASQQVRIGKSAEANLQSLLLDYFEEAMRTPSSALPLMANPFVRTAGQLMFAWSLVGVELEVLTSHDNLKLYNKSLEVYQMSREIIHFESGKKKRCHLFLEVDNVCNDQ